MRIVCLLPTQRHSFFLDPGFSIMRALPSLNPFRHGIFIAHLSLSPPLRLYPCPLHLLRPKSKFTISNITPPYMSDPLLPLGTWPLLGCFTPFSNFYVNQTAPTFSWIPVLVFWLLIFLDMETAMSLQLPCCPPPSFPNTQSSLF